MKKCFITALFLLSLLTGYAATTAVSVDKTTGVVAIPSTKITFPNAAVTNLVTPWQTLSSTAIPMTGGLWKYVAAGNTTFTFTGTPTNGQNIVVAFTNSTTAIVSATWPTTFYDYNSGTMISSLNMPAVKESIISAAYDGAIWRIMSSMVLNSSPTNIITSASTIDMTIPEQRLVATGDITISSLLNTSDTEVRNVTLIIVRNGSNRAIVVPNDCYTIDGLRNWTLSQTSGELRIKSWGRVQTNMTWTPYY